MSWLKRLLTAGTIGSAKRLYNTSSKEAVATIQELSSKKHNGEYICPYCSQEVLKFDENQKHFKCPACLATYNTDKEGIDNYMRQNARSIYLRGQGVPNSAYERQGGFADSALASRQQISMNYFSSKLALFLAGVAFINGIVNFGALTIVSLMIVALMMTYSLYYAFMGYSIATKQLYIYEDKDRFKNWLKTYKYTYFLNIGKRDDVDLSQIIREYEAKERAKTAVEKPS